MMVLISLVTCQHSLALLRSQSPNYLVFHSLALPSTIFKSAKSFTLSSSYSGYGFIGCLFTVPLPVLRYTRLHLFGFSACLLWVWVVLWIHLLGSKVYLNLLSTTPPYRTDNNSRLACLKQSFSCYSGYFVFFLNQELALTNLHESINILMQNTFRRKYHSITFKLTLCYWVVKNVWFLIRANWLISYLPWAFHEILLD